MSTIDLHAIVLIDGKNIAIDIYAQAIIKPIPITIEI